MNLYIIDKQRDLIGKTIKGIQMFYGDSEESLQTIHTEDGGIYVHNIQLEEAECDDNLELVHFDLLAATARYKIANDKRFKQNLIHYMGIQESVLDEFIKEELEKEHTKAALQMAENKKRKYEESKKYIAEYEAE